MKDKDGLGDNEKIINRRKDGWKESIIVPICKKGDRTQGYKYGGIAFLQSLYEIVATFLRNRLQDEADKVLGECQCGFRKGTSVIDQIFVLIERHSICYEYDDELCAIFVDFKQAYGSINRTQVYKAMAELGLPLELISLTLGHTMNKVRKCLEKF